MFMKRFIALAMALVLILVFSTSCDGNNNKVLKVYHFAGNLQENILNQFQREAGITIEINTYSSNEELYEKLANKENSYDVIFPSDYMAERLIAENKLEKLSMNNIPEYNNIDEQYKGLGFDPNNEYTVPYSIGTLGIVYNKTKVTEEVKNWDILWDEKYKDEIIMINNARNVFTVALKKLGYSVNTTNQNEIKEAAELLKAQKPLVQNYVIGEFSEIMANNKAALGVYNSDDIAIIMDENPNLAYVIPENGTIKSVVVMAITKDSKNKIAAEKLINFMTSPDISQRVTTDNYLASPNLEAQKLLSDDFLENKAIYPDNEVQTKNKYELYNNLRSGIFDLYEQLWLEIIQ